jgi:hypothetical protein
LAFSARHARMRAVAFSVGNVRTRTDQVVKVFM